MMSTADLQDVDEEALGFDAEKEDPSLAILRPFDPERIRVTTGPAIISLLIKRIDEGEIDLAPEFQRRARVWDPVRKSRLIESLLLKIPLPVFYVASDGNDRWSVVDGLQRLTTILDFVKDKIKLQGLEYLSQLEGLTFQNLPRNFRRRIEETSLVVHVIQDGTPEAVMINIFKRINTGGLSLTGQEIRNALNKGPVRDFLNTLANSEEFKLATNYSVKDSRMDAQECVLRFMAFSLTNWTIYASDFSSFDLFLHQAMQKINALPERGREGLAASFLATMTSAHEIFGTDAFRKRYDPNDRRKMVSKALFEAWSVNLANCKSEQLERLVRRKIRVRTAFMTLMNTDSDFEISISSSTGSPTRVTKRFEAIRDLIQEVLA